MQIGNRLTASQWHVPDIGSGGKIIPREALSLIPAMVQEVHQGQQHVHSCPPLLARCAKGPGVHHLQRTHAQWDTRYRHVTIPVLAAWLSISAGTTYSAHMHSGTHSHHSCAMFPLLLCQVSQNAPPALHIRMTVVLVCPLCLLHSQCCLVQGLGGVTQQPDAPNGTYLTSGISADGPQHPIAVFLFCTPCGLMEKRQA